MCEYTTLRNYNNVQCGTLSPPGRVEQPMSHTPGHYVVPNYKPIGYDALTHGHMSNGNCNDSAAGFFNITQAYGSGAENCNQQYHQSRCN